LFEGIGIVLGELEDGRRLVGVDLDDCIVDGKLLPYAQAISDQLQTRCEKSPSKTGVKFLLYGEALPPMYVMEGGKKKPTGARRVFSPNEYHAGKIEIYSEDRYFTTTGEQLGTCSTIEDRPTQFKALYDQLVSQTKSQAHRLHRRRRRNPRITPLTITR